MASRTSRVGTGVGFATMAYINLCEAGAICRERFTALWSAQLMSPPYDGEDLTKVLLNVASLLYYSGMVSRLGGFLQDEPSRRIPGEASSDAFRHETKYG